ncbi:MAG: hypothetical protein JNL58_23465 [Planctomyces sp.]|nr:hypothetical protein [Planctomyces sp.]
MSLICGCCPIFHVGIGIAIIVRPQSLQDNGNQGPPPEVGYLFVIVGLFIIAVAWAIGICIILSGKYLSEQRRRVFSIVIAAISCASFPIGTALGVFTLIVLLRPSVIKLYKS